MKTLIILHGWGSSKEKWQKVKENIEKEGFKVLIPDLPGFKTETRLNKTWNLDDYVEWFNDFLRKQEEIHPELAEGFFLLGHSFGGRIGIKYTAKYLQKVSGLFLVSAAGIKKKPSIYKKIILKGAKTTKVLKIEEMPLIKGFWQFIRKIFYCYILRKTDYFKTSGYLKETIKNILEEDLTFLLDTIKVPTFIIWGKKDKITSPKDAFLMKEKIKSSQIEMLDGVGHAPHLEIPEKLSQIILKFLKKNY